MDRYFSGGDGLGDSSKVLSCVEASSTSMVSVIPENSGELSPTSLAPVRMKTPVGVISGHKLRVFQRKEVSSSKSMKSWVVEQYAWNNEVGLLGKKPTDRLATEEVTARATSVMGEPKATCLLGAMEVQVGENPCVEDSFSQIEAAVLPKDIEWKDQGKGSVSPASKELKLVWEVVSPCPMDKSIN
jgi:hypothetical protein